MIDPCIRVHADVRISFAELLAWLHDSIGEEVVAEMRLAEGLPVVRLTGTLQAGRELWRHPNAAVAFEIAGTELYFWPRQFHSAWRLCHELRDGTMTSAVEVELEGGTTVSLGQ
jgi:hypothetical protein